MKLNEKYKEVGIENIIEEIDDEICRIFDKYIKKGFVSENGKLFFEDDELLSRFEYHLGGLQRMIVDTYDIPYSLVSGEHKLEFNFEECYDDVEIKTKEEFLADMEAQDEKFGKHKI